MENGFLLDVRIIDSGYTALREALKPVKVLKVVQDVNRDNFK